VARLATVYPDRVGVSHGELCLLERPAGVVFGHWDEARVEATGNGTTRATEGGLCHRVILLLEGERDGIADVGIHAGWVVLDNATGATDCYWEIGRFHGQDGHEAEQGRERGEFGEHH